MRSPCSPLFYLFIVIFLNSTSITHDEERCKVGLQTLGMKLFASPCYGFHQETFVRFGGLFETTRTANGYFRSRRSIAKWSKHGQTSLLIAGHDQPVDITIYLDVSLNPGPDSVAMNHDRTSASLAFTNKNSLKCGVLNTHSIRNKLIFKCF